MKRLTVLFVAVGVGLTGCGGNTNTEDDSAQRGKPQSQPPPQGAKPKPEAKSPQQEAKPKPEAEPKPKPETGELSAREDEQVAEAQGQILSYCAEPSSRGRRRENDAINDAINTLVRIARRKPEVGFGENSMTDVLDESATLLADCDKDGATRLTRSARSLR